MKDEKFLMFKNRLVKVFRHLSRQAKKAGVTCYRVYDHDLPEFPVCIELYENHLYFAEYKRFHGLTEAEHNAWLEGCLEVVKEVFQTQDENIHVRLRQRKPGRLGQYAKASEQNKSIIVNEQGLKFIVNLSDYLDTGLFLDHRITRKMVKEKSDGASVLNLFGYTGSFSVYAASGGARKVVTVDLSRTYLEWGKRNLQINGFDDSNIYLFLQQDVLKFLEEKSHSDFDIIVLDPPTFSNSKRMNDFFDVQRDHVKLINQTLQLIKPGGILIFSNNYRKFQLEEKALKSSQVKDITRQTTPFDFEGRMQRQCFLIKK